MKEMELKNLDNHAKRIIAAGLDWWNSCTLESFAGQEDQEIIAKLEHDFELGKALFLELTGHEWFQDCPYLEYLK